MATQDMTITLPEDVASLLAQLVDAEGRSRFVVEAIEERLHRKQRLEAACQALNIDPQILQLEKEWEVCVADGLKEVPNEW